MRATVSQSFWFEILNILIQCSAEPAALVLSCSVNQSASVSVASVFSACHRSASASSRNQRCVYIFAFVLPSQLLWPGEKNTCGEDAGKLYWESQNSDGQAWRARGLRRPRRDFADWLALVHFDDEGVSESYLLKMCAWRRSDFQNKALAQSLARLKSTIAGGAPGSRSSSQRSVATVPVAVNSSTCGQALTGFTSSHASTESQMNPSGFTLQNNLF